MDNALPISNALPNSLPIPPLTQPLSYSYAAPVYGCCFPTHGWREFILIVVLFILLIIVGAVCFCR